MKKFLRITVVMVGLWLVVAPASGFLVFHQIQRCLDLKIAGQFVPSFLFPGFYVRDVRFQWEGRVEFLSGDVEVRYDPLSAILGKLLRIRVKSESSSIRLTGDWARMQGVEQARVDRLDAEVGLARKGIREIYGIELESPEFQFHVRKSDK